MATMKDVADYADVSVATVSRVINKTGFVSQDLEVRVHEAMRHLKYQPSALARSLRRQQTQLIGVLIPQLDHPFFSRLAFAIERSLFPHDYHTFICSAEEDPSKELAYTEIMLRQRVDGVLIVPIGQSAESVHMMLEKNIPVVLIDRDLPELAVNRVLVDNDRGGYNGMKYLLELGHRSIGVIGTPVYSRSMTQRMDGAKRAMAEYHLDTGTALMGTGSFDYFQMGYHHTKRLLKSDNPPTAIFALIDITAIGAMHAAAELGFKVPDDLSIMGYDDIPLASFSVPTLTSVQQPIYEMGEVATRLLLTHIQDRVHPVETIVLDTQLSIRQSTATLRVQ
jgi:LacI family transcriptional regulator